MRVIHVTVTLHSAPLPLCWADCTECTQGCCLLWAREGSKQTFLRQRNSTQQDQGSVITSTLTSHIKIMQNWGISAHLNFITFTSQPSYSCSCLRCTQSNWPVWNAQLSDEKATPRVEHWQIKGNLWLGLNRKLGMSGQFFSILTFNFELWHNSFCVTKVCPRICTSFLRTVLQRIDKEICPSLTHSWIFSFLTYHYLFSRFLV